MAASTSTPSISPLDQFILGALIAIGIGIFALFDSVLNTTVFAAIVTGYGTVAIVYGVFLMENSTAISSYWKWVAIIAVSVIAYALTLVANNWVNVKSTLDPVIIAGLVMSVANFALNDLQGYVKNLPDNVVSEITFILGAIVVAAAAVQNAPAGSIINVTTLLTVVVPVILVYVFQRIPWPTAAVKTTTPTAPVTVTPAA